MSLTRLTKAQKAEVDALGKDIRMLWVRLGGRVCECGDLAIFGAYLCGPCVVKASQ